MTDYKLSKKGRLKNLVEESPSRISSINTFLSPLEARAYLKGVKRSSLTEVVVVTLDAKLTEKVLPKKGGQYLSKLLDKREYLSFLPKANKYFFQGAISEKKFSSIIPVYDGEKYILLQVEDIIRMEADGSYTKFILEGALSILSSKRLGYYEKRLDSQIFFRCHNSHIVSIKKIYSIDRGRKALIELKNGETIPASKRKTQKLHEFLNF